MFCILLMWKNFTVFVTYDVVVCKVAKCNVVRWSLFKSVLEHAKHNVPRKSISNNDVIFSDFSVHRSIFSVVMRGARSEASKMFVCVFTRELSCYEQASKT